LPTIPLLSIQQPEAAPSKMLLVASHLNSSKHIQKVFKNCLHYAIGDKVGTVNQFEHFDIVV
jgi:hypothetical protein